MNVSMKNITWRLEMYKEADEAFWDIFNKCLDNTVKIEDVSKCLVTLNGRKRS